MGPQRTDFLGQDLSSPTVESRPACQYLQERRDQGGVVPKGQSKPGSSALPSLVPVILPLPTYLSVLPSQGSLGDPHTTLCQDKSQRAGLFRAGLSGSSPCSLRSLCLCTEPASTQGVPKERAFLLKAMKCFFQDLFQR